MDVSDVCGSVMASEETWVILGRGHLYTSSRGWVLLSQLGETYVSG